MGSPLSGFIAEAFHQKLESLLFTTHGPKFWTGYVYDTFVIIKREMMEEFYNVLNSVFLDIQFTMEAESNNQMSFLDVLVYGIPNGHIKTTVYRKATGKGQILSYHSENPLCYKRGCVRTLYSRAETYCSEPDDRKTELRYLQRLFMTNGYRRNFIESSRQSKPGQHRMTEQPKFWHALPYIDGVSEAVSRLLRPLGIGIAHRPDYGFFRRTEETSSRLVCVGGKDNCAITPRSRNACKACRFRRCLRAGMSKKGSRIGRQPNAVKFHCAIEIRQLQTSGPALGTAAQPPSSSSSQGSKPDIDWSPSLVVTACEIAVNRRPGIAAKHSSVSLGRLCGVAEDGSRASDFVEGGGGVAIAAPPTVNNSVAAAIYEFPMSAPASTECKRPQDPLASRTLQPPRKPDDLGLDCSGSMLATEAPLAEGLAWFSFGIRTATEFLRLPNTYFKSRFEMSTIHPDHANDDHSIWNHLMNHFHMHSQQIVQFAKLIPGFNQLELTARGALVREGMYAAMLLLLARDYEPATGKYNYFDFSAEERNVILSYFPSFTRISDHLSITGRLYQELALTLPEFTLVCAIEILKNFAVLSGASCTHARRFFLLAKHSLLTTMRNQASLREPVEKRCAQLESFSQVLHDLTMEHRDLLFALKTSRQDLYFPELFVEMFQLSVTPENYSPSTATSLDTVAIGSIANSPQTPKTDAAAPFATSWTTCASMRETVADSREENLNWIHPRTWTAPVSSSALGTPSLHAFSSRPPHLPEEPPPSGVDELDGPRFYL
ncbi:hypothetical protein SprV_0702305900 [Sparganum proliferum]